MAREYKFEMKGITGILYVAYLCDDDMIEVDQAYMDIKLSGQQLKAMLTGQIARFMRENDVSSIEVTKV